MSNNITTTSQEFLPNILVVADTGSGKSTSLENLPQDASTRILETEGKSLPFAHKFVGLRSCPKIDIFEAELDAALKDDAVEIIVIDSLSKHIHRLLQYCRATLKGYDIWNGYGVKGFQLLTKLHSTSKIIICTSHAEVHEIEDVNETLQSVKVNKKMAATFMGKELEGKIEPEFTIVLHMELKRTPKGVEHFFITKPDVVTTSKTPKSMFVGQPRIPNDLMLVIKELSKVGYNLKSTVAAK